MNKYIYCETPVDYWPSIKTLMANSYNDAVERLIQKYSEEFEDDEICKIDNLKQLQEYLNETYNLAIGGLEDIEEI